MLGTFKPVAFDPYARRRSRRFLPRWLVLLLAGVAVGAGGVLLVQQRFLPPRLTADESTALQASLEQTEAERLRLESAFGDTKTRLDEALAERKSAADRLAANDRTIEQLRADVSALMAALPPDPRGGAVEVRAARFTVNDGTLAYEVLLTRAQPGDKPLAGVMQVVLAGEPSRGGADNSVTLEPVAVSVDRYESLRGSLRLPSGVRPRQVTVNVLDRVDGKRLALRVVKVR